jgi:hypothetical protein
MPSVKSERLWAASGATAVVLFACGLLFGDVLGSSNYPPLNAAAQRVRDYFTRNGPEVRALSFFHTLSALALLCFGVYLHRRIRAVRPTGVLAAGALAGGITAAGFLLLSALLYRTLAEPAVRNDPALLHALVVMSYLAGGPAIAIPLALPIGAGTTLALRGVLLPRWIGWLGCAAATLCVISAGAFLGPMNNSSALYAVLLLAAITGFLWTFAASIALATRSPSGHERSPRPGRKASPRSLSRPRRDAAASKGRKFGQDCPVFFPERPARRSPNSWMCWPGRPTRGPRTDWSRDASP